MGKIKKQKPKKFKSIKRTFFLYLPVCAFVAYLGGYGIGTVTNELQAWYEMTYSEVNYQDAIEEAYANLEKLPEMGSTEELVVGGEGEEFYGYEIVKSVNGITFYDVKAIGRFVSDNPWHNLVYNMITFAQGFLISAWILGCVALTGILFYKRELERPVNILMEASEKISDNCLDFRIAETKPNELGKLCRSFETMRQALYRNNQELWRTLEERKRLNAAFSHDIRTPLAVLKGYQELLQNYAPEGKISEERLMEMLDTMGNQITRLENYTQKMSAMQKLEDIEPNRTDVDWQEFMEQCRETGELLKDSLELEYRIEPEASHDILCIDRELVMEVYENLLSNAVRFAKAKIEITIKRTNENTLEFIMEDDGSGFSEEALHRATDPFFGSEKDGKVHFGLGLYICKVICEKHQGSLKIENGASGGRVTAAFHI